MPQTKFNCKGCRRLVSIESAFCPFCKTPNEHYKKMEAPTAAEPEKPAPAPVQPTENKTSDAVAAPSPSEPAVPEEEIALESLQAMYKKVPVRQTVREPAAKTGQDKKTTAPGHTDPAPDPEDTAADETDPSGEVSNNTISSSGEVHRSPIDWNDDRGKKEPEYTEMFDEKGEYLANYDGYYNDTLPKIKNEIDRTLANREKIILKGVFSVFAVIAIIIYLVITT